MCSRYLLSKRNFTMDLLACTIYLLRLLAACILVSGEVPSRSILDLSSDFTAFENTGRVRACNFIVCWGADDLKLFREVSSRFRCPMTINHPRRSIKEWYITSHLQLFVLDLTCPGASKALVEASQLELLTGKHVWVVIHSRATNPSNTSVLAGTGGKQMTMMKNASVFANSVRLLEEMDLTISSQVHVALEESPGRYHLTGVYKRDPGTPMIMEDLGKWSATNGINFTAHLSPAMRRYDMEGRMFTATMITNDDSLKHMHDLVDTHIDNLSKLGFQFANSIAAALNARIRYVHARSWGANRNGSFDGMLGYVQRHEAEILLTSLFLTPERMAIVEYIEVTDPARIKFLFLSPPLSYKNNIYTLPFSSGVWYSCCGLFAFSVPFLYVSSIYENEHKIVRKGWKLKVVKADASEEDELKHKNLTRLPNSLSDILLINLGTICQQETVVEPKSVPGRVLILCVKIAILFLYVSYSAAIVVLLQSSDTSITTLNDLLKSNLKLGVHDISYNRFYFQTATDPVRKALAKKVNPETGYLTVEEGVKRVKSGLYAFQVEKTPGYTMVRKQLHEDEKCRLQELKESFLIDTYPQIALRKNWPYSKIIKMMFKRLRESGQIDRESRRYTATKTRCSDNSMTYVSVGLLDCQAAPALLAIGIATSLVILGAEKWHHRRKLQLMISSKGGANHAKTM